MSPLRTLVYSITAQKGYCINLPGERSDVCMYTGFEAFPAAAPLLVQLVPEKLPPVPMVGSEGTALEVRVQEDTDPTSATLGHLRYQWNRQRPPNCRSGDQRWCWCNPGRQLRVWPHLLNPSISHIIILSLVTPTKGIFRAEADSKNEADKLREK